MTGDDQERFHWNKGGYFWAVNLPGLTRHQAEALLTMAERAGMSFGGTTVDPAEFLTLYLDRPSVEILVQALNAVPPGWEPAEPADTYGLASMREELREWLDVMSSE